MTKNQIIFIRLRIAEGERTAIRQDREYKKKHQIDELKKLQRERDEIAKNYELAVSRVSFKAKVHQILILDTFRSLKTFLAK